MSKFIAYCGLDCKRCDARIATVNDDNELRKKVAEEWSKMNGVTITPEMINCTGCRVEGIKTPFCDSMCPIRLCAQKKVEGTCSECTEKTSCQKITMITGTNKEAAERLGL